MTCKCRSLACRENSRLKYGAASCQAIEGVVERVASGVVLADQVPQPWSVEVKLVSVSPEASVSFNSRSKS